MGKGKNKFNFDWDKYDAVKHASLVKAKSQARLVLFTIWFLSVSSLFFMVLLTAIAFGKAALPESFINKLAVATIGQFGGATLLLYKAMFRNDR